VNLIKDPWLWVLRKDGTRCKIAPLSITSQYKTNPVLRVDFSRPDFSAMVTQLLIAIVQTHFSPTKEQWPNLLKKPITGKGILQSLHSVDAFTLDGEGFRFMQDMHPEELTKEKSISTLLFESPGEKTVKEGRDFFVSDSRVKVLCPSCAAVALYSKQVNATMGGAGWRTSIRSGLHSPLTTIILGDTLWETIVFNLIDRDRDKGDLKRAIFPWLDKTVDSSGKGEKNTISLSDKSPYYHLWEMPCRYHLVFEKMADVCDICGDHYPEMIRTVKAKNYGNCYVDLYHTLSPYIESKEGTFFRRAHPVHPNTSYTTLIESLIAYEKDDQTKSYPAPVVEAFLKRGVPGAKLWAYGYIVERKKYFGWAEKIWEIPDTAGKEDSIIELISIASKISYTLELYVKSMLLLKKEGMPSVREDFFKVTEEAFYTALKNPDMYLWVHILVVKAFEVFDHYVGRHKIPLQIWKKEAFIEKINKEILKKRDLPLLDPEKIIKKSHYKSHKSPRFFTSDVRSMILSWYRRQELNTEAHSSYGRCNSPKEVLALGHFQNFISSFMVEFKSKKIPDHVIRDRMAAAFMIISRVKSKKFDLSEAFPVQLTRINSRHIKELLYISDPLKEWKVFEYVLGILPRINFLDFIESFVNWNSRIKKYWDQILSSSNY